MWQRVTTAVGVLAAAAQEVFVTDQQLAQRGAMVFQLGSLHLAVLQQRVQHLAPLVLLLECSLLHQHLRVV